MMNRFECGFLFLVTLACGALGTAQPARAGGNAFQYLREGWSIQSSAKVTVSGNKISSSGYSSSDWYPATLPSTVIAALVRQRAYADPDVGMNLREITGTSYPVGENFSNLPMPPESPFSVPWWFRTEFKVPQDYRGKTMWLHFDGINYRASVWLNGQQVAAPQKMVGAWRVFEFDVTKFVTPGQTNRLAVEIWPPHPDDLAITFVDWNPLPADKDMGIWRDVYIKATGPVVLRYPQVISKLDLPALNKAHLTVTAELANATEQTVEGTLKGKIEGVQFSQAVTLRPKDVKVISFTPDTYPQLEFNHPRVWWPHDLGPQNLYPLEISFETAGKTSDSQSMLFGIREISADLDSQQHRLFQINGVPILIRGAGYTFDMLLRTDPARQEEELNYVKDMHLNTVRLEGKIEDDHFFELSDRMGILVLAGWCCCDHWEAWPHWKSEDYVVSTESLKDQIRRLRSHPSLLDWLYGSDTPPVEKVERAYIQILKDNNWPNPYQSSASAQPTSVTGKTGLKMLGPYEYVPPSYWLLDKERGGAHGFNTETSPGTAVPPVESLKRMLPHDHLWPIDSTWDFHAGGGVFRDIQVFTEALNKRYGSAKGLEDYAEKAQVITYEGERAMFEAFGRNKYTSTGVIQWMLNNAWPSMIWHLYDYYLRPGGGYFGTKKGCEYLHVQYSYDDSSIVVVNSYYQTFPQMKVTARVFNLDMSLRFSKVATLDVDPDSAVKVFTIPALPELSGTYFLRLDLADASGRAVSNNFYWLSTHPDVLDWEGSTLFNTPSKTFADFTALQGLPKVDLQAAARSEMNGDEGTTRVTLTNPSTSLAFFVHLKVTAEGGVPYVEGGGDTDDEVLPILWSDNYISLLPGEQREITATYAKRSLRSSRPQVTIDGWNVAPRTLEQ